MFDLKTASIAFVDSTLEQQNILIEGISADRVILLHDQADQIEQITQALARYRDLNSIHIFSHSSNGAIQLGDVSLGQANLRHYEAQLKTWGNALSEQGDLLFYGCNLAQNDAGIALVNDISQLTQADVAASDDITGHVSLGGDWELEIETGQIETSITLNQATQISYQGLKFNHNLKKLWY